MKDRLFWIPTLIILATPIVVAVVCMVLEVRWKTWIALANGLEPANFDAADSSRPVHPVTPPSRTYGSRRGSGTLNPAGRHRGLTLCCRPERLGY